MSADDRNIYYSSLFVRRGRGRSSPSDAEFRQEAVGGPDHFRIGQPAGTGLRGWPIRSGSAQAARSAPYSVGELCGLLDIVRDQYDGARALMQDTRQFLPHTDPGQVIQR